MVQHAAEFAYGLLGILALVLVDALCFYALWYVVLLLVSYVPIVGHRHKHERWDELNAVGPARRPRASYELTAESQQLNSSELPTDTPNRHRELGVSQR